MNNHHKFINHQPLHNTRFILPNQHFNPISSSPKSPPINFTNNPNQHYPTKPNSNSLFIPIHNHHQFLNQNNSPKTPRKQFTPLSQSKYSIELKHMKKEIQSLKENLQKKQHPEMITTKRQSVNNQLCLSFTNTEQNNRQITLQQNIFLPQQSKVTINMELDKAKNQRKDKKYQNAQENKIDLILKKVCQLELSERGITKDDQQSKLDNNNQLILSLLLQKIHQKNIQLKRIEVKHLSLFLNYSNSQYQAPTPNIQHNNYPKQWKLFENQLNTLLTKFQYIFKDYQKRISDQKLYIRNINGQSDKHKDIRNNQIKRIIDQNALKEEENQILKLQYLKLKNKILTMQEYNSEIQYEIKRYKESGKAYLSEISNLQQLVVSLKQKIQIINAIKNKKQEIEKQYHRIFNELNAKILEKQKIIIQLKKNINHKKKDEHQLQYQSYVNKVEMDKQKFNQKINEINSRISTQVEKISNNLQNYDKTTLLIKELAKKFNIEFKEQQETIQQIINQIDQNEYMDIYEHYMQVMRVFGVQYNRNDNYHELLMSSIHNFHSDLKLMFIKVDEIDMQVRKKQQQLKSMSQQLGYYQTEFNRFSSQQFHQSIIQKKLFLQDTLLIPPTFQNNNVNC